MIPPFPAEGRNCHRTWSRMVKDGQDGGLRSCGLSMTCQIREKSLMRRCQEVMVGQSMDGPAVSCRRQELPSNVVEDGQGWSRWWTEVMWPLNDMSEKRKVTDEAMSRGHGGSVDGWSRRFLPKAGTAIERGREWSRMVKMVD
jgi:hypothetical protein